MLLLKVSLLLPVVVLTVLQKLVEISRLKEQRAAGRQLELNQLDKIKKEDELLKELQGLVL
jgi:translation initiation factor 2A